MENEILFIDSDIPQKAYKGDSTLRYVRIGKNVSAIGAEAFSMCSNIESIKVDPENKWFTSGDDCNAIIEKSSGTLLVGCSQSKIPEYITEIGPFAFCGQTLLKQITIPCNVRKIGAFSFDGCSELTEIKIGENVEVIGEYCFKKCGKLETIYLPDKYIDIDATVFGVTPFDWNDMEASLKGWEEEPEIEPHFMGMLNIFFDGTVENYYMLGDFVDKYLSCSYIENTRIINVFCKDAKITSNKWKFNV